VPLHIVNVENMLLFYTYRFSKVYNFCQV